MVADLPKIYQLRNGVWKCSPGASTAMLVFPGGRHPAPPGLHRYATFGSGPIQQSELLSLNDSEARDSELTCRTWRMHGPGFGCQSAESWANVQCEPTDDGFGAKLLSSGAPRIDNARFGVRNPRSNLKQ